MRRADAEGRRVFTGTLVEVPQPASEANGESQDNETTTVFGLEFEAKKNEKQVVTFMVQDLDRAKLDPVLDFKGKKR